MISIIITITVFVLLLFLVYRGIVDDERKFEDWKNERSEKFHKLGGIGGKVRFLRGKYFGEKGTIVGSGFCLTVSVKLDNGEYETMVDLDELELITN